MFVPTNTVLLDSLKAAYDDVNKDSFDEMIARYKVHMAEESCTSDDFFVAAVGTGAQKLTREQMHLLWQLAQPDTYVDDGVYPTTLDGLKLKVAISIEETIDTAREMFEQTNLPKEVWKILMKIKEAPLNNAEMDLIWDLAHTEATQH